MDETLQLPRRLSTASNDRSPSPHHSRQPSTDTDKTGEGYWSEIERAELSQAAHDDDHLSTDEDYPDSPSKLKLSDESPKHDSQPWTEQHDMVFKVTSMIPAFVKGTCEAIVVPYFLAEGVPFATAFLILCAGPLLLREIEPMLDGTRLWLSTASFGIFMGSMLLICSWRIGTALADPHHVTTPLFLMPPPLRCFCVNCECCPIEVSCKTGCAPPVRTSVYRCSHQTTLIARPLPLHSPDHIRLLLTQPHHHSPQHSPAD